MLEILLPKINGGRNGHLHPIHIYSPPCFFNTKFSV
uniref:Uncharacterized protein n=1 Tax=Anguilla anguilla TaxID=7936 RepID=A0A0E9TX38_ANGAN